MEAVLNELVTRLKEAFGSDLKSVVLYGSAAVLSDHTKASDLNVICVLPRVGVAELEKAGKTVHWWITKHKQPPPLFLSTDEIECRNDVFPVEFIDIQQSRKVLYGEDSFAAIQIDRANHRAQVEHEISSNILRLRQRYLVLRGNDKDVLRMMTESVSSLATMARHALILSGRPAPAAKCEIFTAVAEAFSLDAHSFLTLLRVREETEKPTGAQVHDLFAAYLRQITALEGILDRM